MISRAEFDLIVASLSVASSGGGRRRPGGCTAVLCTVWRMSREHERLMEEVMGFELEIGRVVVGADYPALTARLAGTGQGEDAA